MARLVFKLILNSDNAPTIVGVMLAIAAAWLALRAVVAVRRAVRYARAEKARQAHLARWRAVVGCDPRSLTSAELASITLTGVR